MTQTVLIVDDEPDTCELISEVLTDAGYRALVARTSADMWRQLEREPADLIVLDYRLPDANGLDLAREIRFRSKVGLIMISGKVPELDAIIGLELAADDYVEKPFTPRMLLARVNSVLRRTSGARLASDGSNGASEQPRGVVTFEGWMLDLPAYKLTDPARRHVHLTTSEFAVLEALLERPNQVITRGTLIARLRGDRWDGLDRAIDTIISRLRKKVAPSDPSEQFIKTVRGIGYAFTASVQGRVPRRNRG